MTRPKLIDVVLGALLLVVVSTTAAVYMQGDFRGQAGGGSSSSSFDPPVACCSAYGTPDSCVANQTISQCDTLDMSDGNADGAFVTMLPGEEASEATARCRLVCGGTNGPNGSSSSSSSSANSNSSTAGGSADLKVTVNCAAGGSTVTCNISLDNLGPNAASNVTFDAFSAGDIAITTADGSPANNPTNAHWVLPGTIAVGNSAHSIVIGCGNGGTGAGSVSVTVSASTMDPVGSNNTAPTQNITVPCGGASSSTTSGSNSSGVSSSATSGNSSSANTSSTGGSSSAVNSSAGVSSSTASSSAACEQISAVSLDCGAPVNGQWPLLCPDVHTENIQLSVPASLTLHYDVPSGHCARVRWYVRVDGVLKGITAFAGFPGGPGPLTVSISLGTLSAGPHVVTLQPEGDGTACGGVPNGLSTPGGDIRISPDSDTCPFGNGSSSSNGGACPPAYPLCGVGTIAGSPALTPADQAACPAGKSVEFSPTATAPCNLASGHGQGRCFTCAANVTSSAASSNAGTCGAGQFCSRNLIANTCLAVNPCGPGQSFVCSGNACTGGNSCTGSCCSCQGGGSSSSAIANCSNNNGCTLLNGNSICGLQGKGCTPVNYGVCYVCAGTCGDYTVDAGEDCDDGNTRDDGNGCAADCSFTANFCALDEDSSSSGGSSLGNKMGSSASGGNSSGSQNVCPNGGDCLLNGDPAGCPAAIPTPCPDGQVRQTTGSCQLTLGGGQTCNGGCNICVPADQAGEGGPVASSSQKSSSAAAAGPVMGTCGTQTGRNTVTCPNGHTPFCPGAANPACVRYAVDNKIYPRCILGGNVVLPSPYPTCP